MGNFEIEKGYLNNLSNYKKFKEGVKTVYSNTRDFLEHSLEKILDSKRETGVLIIDMQEYFLQHLDPFEKGNLVNNITNLTSLCEKKDIPMVILEFGSPTLNIGETESSLKKEIKKVPRHVYISKPERNGFKDTELYKTLKRFYIKDIILTGVRSSKCVLETSIEAKKAGFGIITSPDLIGDYPFNWMDRGHVWFKKNGLFLPSYENLIQTVEAA